MRPILLAVLCLLASPAGAGIFGTPGRGTTSAQFLEFGAGARAAAMGEAYSAAADDATALYWNPAALTGIKHGSVVLMHAPYINSSHFDYAAYGRRWGERAAVGASVQYFSAGSINQTDAAGAELGGLAAYDLAVSLGFAYRLRGSLDGYSAGISGKFVQSRILHTAQTGAVDVGTLSPPMLDGKVKLAFSILNVGGTLKFDKTSAALPLTMKLGGVYQLKESILLSSDIGLPRNDRPFLALGSEYRFKGVGDWWIAGRGGFNTQSIGSIDGFTGLSVGVGIGFGSSSMDYAFVPLGGIGQAHRLSLSFNF
jgi:hypothetical protein